MSATNSNFSPTAGPMLVICSSTEIILKLTLSGLSCFFFHTCRPQTGGEVKNPDKGGPARNERPVRLICLRLGGGQGGFSPWGGRKPPDLSSRRPAGPGPWRPDSLSRPLGKARALLIISLAGMEGARVIGLLGFRCQLSLRQHPPRCVIPEMASRGQRQSTQVMLAQDGDVCFYFGGLEAWEPFKKCLITLLLISGG